MLIDAIFTLKCLSIQNNQKQTKKQLKFTAKFNNLKLNCVMKTQQQDPLRFLKARKKQFHLTPTKPSKIKQFEQINSILKIDSPNQSYQNSLQVSLQSSSHKQKDKAYQFFQKKKSIRQDNKKEANQKFLNNKNNEYNPLKYFSKDVESFLKNRHYKRASGTSQTIFQTEVLPLQKLTHQPIDFTIPLKKQNVNQSYQNTMRLQDYFQNSGNQQSPKSSHFNMEDNKNEIQQYQNTIRNDMQKIGKAKTNKTSKIHNKKQQSFASSASPIPSQQINRIKKYNSLQNESDNYKQTYTNEDNTTTFSKPNNKNRNQQKSQHKRNYFSNENSAKNNIYNDNNNKEEEEMKLASNNQQLEQCPTCHRKFNPNSYEKHVKVCQKVFYKKRKQFSSQKQRSMSKNKK